ncbi:MAG: hypothetical protein K6F50_04535 [Kiritimatiellae bacterium]|nr:hypothetical protein [Kiritimatiellia bacterium]
MKPSEILAALPEWSSATPAQLLSNPAWALPCRLGDTPAMLRFDAIRPADTLNIAVKLEDEEHAIGISDSAIFPELHKIWPSRKDVPEPILLALVEKECGKLLQLLENAFRRQLAITGMAREGAGKDSLAGRVVSAGNDLVAFTVSNSPSLTDTLGQLRYIDIASQTVRSRVLPAEVEIASFALSPGDVPMTGDMLLLPEVDPSAPVHAKLAVDGRFNVDEGTGVTELKDAGLWRVVLSSRIEVPFGALSDLAAGAAAWSDIPDFARLGEVPPETALSLVRAGKTIATGRLARLGAQTAFAIDATA